MSWIVLHDLCGVNTSPSLFQNKGTLYAAGASLDGQEEERWLGLGSLYPVLCHPVHLLHLPCRYSGLRRRGEGGRRQRGEISG